MGIFFGRDICNVLSVAERREWLVTNGIGGYASGTVSGLLTRRYHGLLVAALKPPVARTLLVSKIDETLTLNGKQYLLFANRWTGNVLNTEGTNHIESFELEGTTPVWTFSIGNLLLQKRIWMEYGENTTYVRYDVLRADEAIELNCNVLVNYRDYHSLTRAGSWQMNVEPVSKGLVVNAFEGANPFYVLSSTAEATVKNNWYFGYFLSVENARGQGDTEDHLHAGALRAVIKPGQSLTLVISTKKNPSLDGAAAYKQQLLREKKLISNAKLPSSTPDDIKQLVLAADQFIVKRTSKDEPDGRTVIAGYHWFSDWGRDTMISLPGLTLATGRGDDARKILRTFARYVDQGMLPNRFPDAGETPEYNTVDATLWYFKAIRSYFAAIPDSKLLKEIFPVLEDIIIWHKRGTRYQIHEDPADGLLYSGEPGVQLTWMDAKVGEWVITPRTGKAVEINALWYNALRSMADLSAQLKKKRDYAKSALVVQKSFQKFWAEDLGYCFDVIEGPNGNDNALRPNQLFAISLAEALLTTAQQKAVLQACSRLLLTPHGLRSLTPESALYRRHYKGNGAERDAAYHQGTVWSWLIGPFVESHLRVYKKPALAREYLLPLLRHIADHGVGSISEIFDGDAPHTPRGCIAQAWGVAELLRVWKLTQA